jgi:hypothetical protein
LQASDAFGDEAFTPFTDGVAFAPHLVGNDLVGRVVRCCRSQDDATAEDQRLRCRAGTHQRFQLDANVCIQLDHGTEGARHDLPPAKDLNFFLLEIIMATHDPFG